MGSKQPVNFGAAREAAEASGALGTGGFFKVKEGSNRIRLVSNCIPHTDSFKGRKNFKWLCYVIDRTNGAVRPYFMPHTIYKMVEALQGDPDYTFDSVPMPYDVTINAKGAGSKEVEYSLLPAKNNVPLTPAEEADVEAQDSLEALQKKIYEKKEQDQPFDPDAIPA